MPMEGQVKFLNLQNAAEVSKEKDKAVISQTVAVKSDQDSNIKTIDNKTIKCLHTAEASTFQVVLNKVTDTMF